MRIQGADLRLFEFDYDLTWVAFFLSPEERVYGRYGSRDAAGPDTRMSLAGFRYAMQSALAKHRDRPGEAIAATGKAMRVDDYPAAKRTRGECIHCHQVWEFRRDYLKSTGAWKRDDVWVYPLPENVGITLDVDRGDRVTAVSKGSPAEHSGLAAGDRLRKLNGYSVASIADAQYALHKAPQKGTIDVVWERDRVSQSGALALENGWRKTNVTWRPSMLDILPSISLYGDDLSVAEKRALGLSASRLAFRQDKTVHRDMKAAGVQPGDIIVGIDGLTMEMTMTDFLGYIRRNYLIGERITLNLFRGGKRVDLPVTLR